MDFTIDTGLMFRETQELRYKFIDKYGINLRVFEPELSVPKQEKK